jgi:hypothetical protein
MRWLSFAGRLTVTRASEAVFIVPPQDRRPRTRCAYCGHVLRLDHPWLVVWPLTREEGFRTVVATIDPLPGEAWCEDCAHTWFGVNLGATDAPASAGEYWGTLIRSAVHVQGTRHGFAYRLRPGWRSTLMTLSVKSKGKEARSPMAFVRWRGNCTQLLASVSVDGRPRQRLLRYLHGAYRTTPQFRQRIADAFPDVSVDWAAVDRSLAQGPPPAIPPSLEQLQWADAAHRLSVWATTNHDPEDRRVLTMAAEILTRWQSDR